MAEADPEVGADGNEATDPSASLLAGSKPESTECSPRYAKLRLRLCSNRFTLLSFLTSYVLAIVFLHFYSARDPTSFFFNETLGYSARYSAIRTQQALDYIDLVNNSTLIPSSQRSVTPSLCVAVPTIARPGGAQHQYVRQTIGSLLDGLSATKRADLHLILFLAHIDAHAHPVYGERWTHILPDQVLSYTESGRLGVPAAQIQRWESAAAYIPKGLFDYAVALDACAATGAPLLAVFEGDVLAARGWMARALRAAEAVARAEADGGTTSRPSHLPHSYHRWLYVRLFYTETYLGWNREYWRTYLGYSILCGIATLLLLRGLRRRFGPRTVSGSTMCCVLSLALPATLALLFLAGRLTVFPPSPGVARIDRFGCCSQAMLFPAVHAPWLVSELRANWEAASADLLPDSVLAPAVDDTDDSNGAGESGAGEGIVKTRNRKKGYVPYVDMLLEHLAETMHLTRYAAVPALVQHVGRASSKGDPIADARAKRIWSFAFEDLDERNGVRGIGWTEGVGSL